MYKVKEDMGSSKYVVGLKKRQFMFATILKNFNCK